MSSIIAKKYANALINACLKDEKKDVLVYLDALSKLYKDNKFLEIIKSPLVPTQDKQDLILGKLKQAPLKFVNLIKILAEAKRLLLVPNIFVELESSMALENKTFKAVLDSAKNFTNQEISNLQKTLVEKVGVDLTVEARNSNYEGLKVEINDLGLRVDFSEAKIKEQILTHILRGI